MSILHLSGIRLKQSVYMSQNVVTVLTLTARLTLERMDEIRVKKPGGQFYQVDIDNDGTIDLCDVYREAQTLSYNVANSEWLLKVRVIVF